MTQRKTYFLITLVCALISALCLPTLASAVTVNSTERALVGKINSYRKAHGLRPVVLDVKLTRTSEWMSRDMASYNYFSHTDRLRRSPFKRMAAYLYPTNTWRGENLAAGNPGVAGTFTQWKNSPGHNANMLNPNYRAIGIARAYSARSQFGYYWTSNYGSKVTARVTR